MTNGLTENELRDFLGAITIMWLGSLGLSFGVGLGLGYFVAYIRKLRGVFYRVQYLINRLP